MVQAKVQSQTDRRVGAGRTENSFVASRAQAPLCCAAEERTSEAIGQPVWGPDPLPETEHSRFTISDNDRITVARTVGSVRAVFGIDQLTELTDSSECAGVLVTAATGPGRSAGPRDPGQDLESVV